MDVTRSPIMMADAAPLAQPPRRNLAWLAKHHFGVLRVLCFMLCLMPALWLAGEWLTDSLGIHRLNRLLHFTGRWALIMLALSLSVTPLRRLSVRWSQHVHARYGKRVSDWNWLIRLRRQLGLFTLFYAGLHLLMYALFDAALDLASVREDLQERPYIVVGFIAFLLLLPLAATSSQGAMRWMGGAWRRLHALAYLIALLSLLHFWMLLKHGDDHALPYTVVLGGLLAARLLAWWRGERGAAVEVKER